MKLLLGDCRAVLKALPDNSIDAVVTDPPYGLINENNGFHRGKESPFKRTVQRTGFMGKEWDGAGIEYSIDMWSEVLRVLKPGGHLLSFGGTRTYHRMACAIEDAGFEIRDQIQYLYGSGFPKSYNISKGIDKRAGAEREVIGEKPTVHHGVQADHKYGYASSGMIDITAPAPPEAQQWDGWGSALKPANEIICLAKKPLTLYGVRDIIVENLLRLEGQLWSLLSVSTAEKNFGSSQKEYEEACASAQWSAEERQHTLDDLLGQMDMSQLELVIVTILNIASSWKNILDDILKHSRTFTTEMESGMTIDLRILNSSLSALTPLSTIQGAISPNGNLSNVSTVASLFSAVNTKLNYTLTTSAPENATLRDGLKDLRPNSSPICLARKPLSEKTIVENVLKWGTGGINVDGGRIGTEQTITQEKSGMHGCGSTDKMREQGFRPYKEDNRYQPKKLNPPGRFPANLILDEEAAEMLGEPSRFFKQCDFRKDELCINANIAEQILNPQRNQDDSVQRDVAISDNQEENVTPMEQSQVTLDCIGDFKECSLIQNLVQYAEQKDNTDIIQIIQNHLKSFGFVLPATEESTSWGIGEREERKSEPLRFKYTPKASRKERNAGLDSYVTMKYNKDKSILGGLSWNDVSMVVVQLLRRATSDMEAVSFNIGESGESITVQCHKDSLSIISTEISKIIELKILNSLTHSRINEFIADVNCAMVNGGNHVMSAESSNLLPMNSGISQEKVIPLMDAVKNVISELLLRINERDEWKDASNFHSTVKPISLMRYLCRLITPPNGVVLDPFMGSGTTGCAAVLEGFDFIGIEQDAEYMEIAKRRIEYWSNK